MENNIIKAGTKIVIKTYACIGAENTTAYILERDYTQYQLDDIAWQEGVQYADSYGIYPPYDGMGEDEEYSEDIEGYWEYYDSSEHDSDLIFGSNNDFSWNWL